LFIDEVSRDIPFAETSIAIKVIKNQIKNEMTFQKSEI